ncbi:protein kinase domain-containing protein [Nocardia cyriacigeorgica]|uniref:protein kinase domain-containing protein n=1 Tax=Nocardia cyriacigeorgica TaxID=135487 RepID=UPI001895230F|nr:protein kinase [Nocardia cyriacigeorgica]MBF6414985.1 protein kinase [Nocardia cyriacigeorgica]
MVDGAAFGRYRLGRIIGEGGMGRVYEAFDTVTERTVALKVLPEALAGNREFRERFRREAHAAARLSEPHIVPIHDYGEIDGRLFLDMRLIHGMDLGTVVAQHGPLPPARAVHVIDQVAAALDAAHAAGLVHRDVKPSNIVLGDRDFAYLIDFGIARDDSATAMTSIGTTLGTFAYMAPERFTPGEQTDARADIYALACVLYECLTGARPFPGAVLAEQIAAHLTAEPPRPSSVGQGIPAALDEVIARGMAKLPDQRFPGAGEFAAAARRALGAGGPIDADPRRAPTWIGSAADNPVRDGAAPTAASVGGATPSAASTVGPAPGASTPGGWFPDALVAGQSAPGAASAMASASAPGEPAPGGWSPGAPVVGESAPGASSAPTVVASQAASAAADKAGIGGLAVACLMVVCGLTIARLIAAMASYGERHAVSFPDFWLPILALVTVLALAVRALIVRRRSAVIACACVLFVASFPMALGDWPADVTANVATALGVSRALVLLVVFAALAVLMGVGVAAGAPRRAAMAGPDGLVVNGIHVDGGAVRFATWVQRVGAALLDGLPAGLLAGLGFGLARASSGAHSSGGSSGGGLVVMMLCYTGLIAYVIWNVGVRQGRSGQSWGKTVVGISVVAAHTGRPLGVGRSIGRQLAHIVDALPCYLGFLFPLWDAKAQTFADKIAGSVVVVGTPAPSAQHPAADPRMAVTEVAAHSRPSAEADAADDSRPGRPGGLSGAPTTVEPRLAVTEVTPHSLRSAEADAAADSRPGRPGGLPSAPTTADSRLAGTGNAAPPSNAAVSGTGQPSQGRIEFIWGAAVLAVVAVVGVAVAVTQAESRTDKTRLPRIVDTIAMPAGAREIAVDPDNRRAYVTGRAGTPVSVIDTATNTVVATIPVGPNPAGVAVDPARGTLYVTDRDERTVTLTDTGTRAAVASIPVGFDPVSVIVDPDTPTIYVIGGSHVSVVDTGTRTVTATIPVDSGTRKAALDPGADTLYVVADTDLTMIDTRTAGVIDSLAIPTYDYPNPLDVAVDPATHLVYVTAYGADDSDGRTLSIIDPGTRAVLAAPVADGNALDIAVDPSDHTAYIANYTDVKVVDTQTRAQIGAIDLVAGHSAEDIAVDTTSHTVYVADGRSVQVISR